MKARKASWLSVGSPDNHIEVKRLKRSGPAETLGHSLTGTGRSGSTWGTRPCCQSCRTSKSAIESLGTEQTVMILTLMLLPIAISFLILKCLSLLTKRSLNYSNHPTTNIHTWWTEYWRSRWFAKFEASHVPDRSQVAHPADDEHRTFWQLCSFKRLLWWLVAILKRESNNFPFKCKKNASAHGLTHRRPHYWIMIMIIDHCYLWFFCCPTEEIDESTSNKCKVSSMFGWSHRLVSEDGFQRIATRSWKTKDVRILYFSNAKCELQWIQLNLSREMTGGVSGSSRPNFSA